MGQVPSSTGEQFPASSLPLQPNICLPERQGSLLRHEPFWGGEYSETCGLRRQGCWQVPRRDSVLAVIHTPSPHSSSLRCCGIRTIFIPILQMGKPGLNGISLDLGQRLTLS